MVDFEYLYPGLCGLARAHRAGTMAGHLGAALVAGYAFGEDQGDLDAAVYRGVEGELDRILRGEEAIWFNPEKAGIRVPDLFLPLPEEPARKESIATLAETLAANIARMRQSGHNVIFASLAIRALQDHPVYATPSLVGGIRKLIAGFHGAHPGRGYYGKDRGWLTGDRVSLREAATLRPYASVEEMAAVTVDELIATAAVHRQGFGGLWHLINHAAALAELARYGHRDLAGKGFAAHRQHVLLWRSLPDVSAELGPMKKAVRDPLTAAYWTEGGLKRDQARLTHRIKTLYGFSTLLECVADPDKRGKAADALRYLMA
jgi:hypothetical protein